MNALRTIATLALLLFACMANAQPHERILDYHTDIVVAVDGSMDVTESIKVVAEGRQIRHGIYRDFPTEYRDRFHNHYHIDFKVLGARRDGQPETWRTERRANGVRIYLGDSTTTVSPGAHDYTLHYRVTREIGFFADHDALFWNVNGTGWGFAAEHISADVSLPRAVAASRLKAFGYTGTKGSMQQALTVKLRGGGASYAATRALAPHEALSIVLQFPKGIVTAPTTRQKILWLLHDNRNLLWGLIGLLALWAWYLVAWNRHGRDPAPGPLVAEYGPPDGDSAAALRYVRQMGYDDTCFTAGILGIAAKGGLSVEHRDDGVWVVHRKKGDGIAALTTPEQTLRNALFGDADELVFKQEHHARISGASNAFKAALEKRFKNIFFHTNTLFMVPGLIITVIALWLGSDNHAATGFILLWLAIWSIAVAALIRNALQVSADGGKGAVGAWLFAAVFTVFELLGLFMLGHVAGYAAVPVFAALIATNIAFWQWLKAPTARGAKLLDRINGFRWYLGVAEKPDLDARYQPESHPEWFASYLPYALALGVSNAWAERFASALGPAQMQQAQPSWYSGGAIGLTGAGLAGFASDMSSGFGGAIASSSVAPGSSGGGGGGAGGGGGGGGGGGW